MSEPAYSPLDIVTVMEALGIDVTVREAVFEAAEEAEALNAKTVSAALKSAGASIKDRIAVLRQLGGTPGSPMSPISAAMSPISAAGPSPHEASRAPSLCCVPFSCCEPLALCVDGAHCTAHLDPLR